MESHRSKKSGSSSSFSIGSMTVLVLAFGIILIGFNYWHAMKCVQNGGMGDLEDYAKAIEKRLLEVESQGLKNNILLEKVLKEVEHRLAAIDVVEMQKLVESSKDEAVKLALDLALHRAPPMPEFRIDEKYEDPNELNNLIDDMFQLTVDKEEQEESFEQIGGQGINLLNEEDDYSEGEEEMEGESISDEEKRNLCIEWKQTYSVVTGVSWGSLPYELQRDWKKYDCDHHIVG